MLKAQRGLRPMVFTLRLLNFPGGLKTLAIVAKQATVATLLILCPCHYMGIVRWTLFNDDLRSDPRKRCGEGRAIQGIRETR